MRVLMLNYEFPPLGGGAGHATACLLREFAGMSDLAVDLVTSSPGPERVESFAANITIHYLDIGKSGDLHYQTMRDLFAYARKGGRCARRLVRQGRYDLCHAFFGIPCGHIACRLRLPYIVSLRGSDVPFYNERFRVLDRLVFARMSVRIWRRADFVVANSVGLRQLALRTAPDEAIEVIPNGVDTEMFRPGHVPHGGLRAVCVARLIARKRVDVLIRAVAALRDTDLSVTLVGTGNEQSALRRLAARCGVAHRVQFAGNVPRESLAHLYRESDVFVLPSVSEGMSNAALEAMACGLPLVMTDTGGAAELLRDGQNGFLVKKDCVEDVCDALRRYMASPALARRHGARCREIAEGLSWRRAASRYVDLYAQTARRPAA